MKNRITLFVALLVLATLACQTLVPQAEPTVLPAPTFAPVPTRPQTQNNNAVPLTEDQVPRIEVHDAKAALDSGQAILVDVRSADLYAAGHADIAISIPLDNFENNIGSLSLDKSQWIITYCT